MTLIPAEELQSLPPELLLDRNNPANDEYFHSLQAARSLAVQVADDMHHRHVEVTKLYQTGRTPGQIATDLKYHRGTVSQILARPDVKHLLRVLRHMAHLHGGPNLEVKQNMLWRIAAENEKQDPGVAIQALKELNKLAGAYPVQESHVRDINITINDEKLPRTALDG